MSQVMVENISSDSSLKITPLKNLAQKVLGDFKEKGGLNIILVPDRYMKDLNLRFSRRRGVTDVLSFSFKEDKLIEGEKEFLGEVYISVDKARRQAKSYKVTLEEELKRLVIHGILHLLGYNHDSKKDRGEMRRREDEYIFSKGVKR